MNRLLTNDIYNALANNKEYVDTNILRGNSDFYDSNVMNNEYYDNFYK